MDYFKLDYSYDYDYDLIDVAVENYFKYNKSIELGNGIILDLDKNNVPEAFEFISASKILGIDKKCLISPDIEILIMADDKLIKFEFRFKYFIDEIEHTISIKQNIANNYDVPSIEVLLSTV